MKTHFRASLVLILVFGPSALQAQLSGPNVPDSLSFQGFLVDDSGVPIDDAVDITFKLYKDANEIWSHTKANVAVSNGVFNVILGGTGLTSLDTVAFNVPIELGIKVGADPEISPRTPLTSAAFALGMRGMYAVLASDGDGNESLNVIGGAANNSLGADVVGATIGGGGGILFGGGPVPNSVADDFGTVGGGIANTAGKFATIAGGESNAAGGQNATVGGGVENTAGGFAASVGGGGTNSATGNYAAVNGGSGNSATGNFATIYGGSANTASGQNSTVAGGRLNRARGGFSLAAGQSAKADHSGTFVWADSASDAGVNFLSTGVNQFLIRASGGVGIGTNAPSAPLDIQGGNWDFSTGEGDVRIGSSTQRLKIGIATGGGGAGIARLNAVGTVPRIFLGTNNTDIVAVSPTSFSPNTDDATSLGTSSNVWTEVWATDGTINSSDRRLKSDVRAIGYGLEEVLRLQPVVYQWISHPEKGGKLGLIAQDVETIIPEVVHHGESPDDMLGLSYAELVPVLIKAIQEQQETIEAQNLRLEALETRMTN